MVAFSVFSLCFVFLFIYEKIHLFDWSRADFNGSFISAYSKVFLTVSFLRLIDMEVLWAFRTPGSCMPSMCSISELYSFFPHLWYWFGSLLVRFWPCQPCFAIHNAFLKCNSTVGKDCCFQNMSYFLAAWHFCKVFSCFEYSFLFLNAFS